jgi:hypothetical protein
VGDLGFHELHIEVVDPGEQAQREHVLATLRIVDDGQALLFHGNFDDAVAGRRELLHRRLPFRANRLVPVLFPHVLEQYDRVRLERVQAVPGQQHLLVESDDQIGSVAPVGHRFGADPNAVAAGPGRKPRRRLDLGRDDLDRPHAVAHLRAHGAEDLSALLGAFAGVRDDLYRV